MVQPKSQDREEFFKLYEISRVINSSLDLKTVLQFIMNITNDIFKAEAGSIMLINSEGKLIIEVAQGLSEEVIRNTEVVLGEGIAGWVAQKGEPLLLDGKVEDSRFTALVDRKDVIKSSLCVPLKTKEKIIGVLMLRNPTSSPKFTTDHLRFLSAIADQAAIAVENARLYRGEKERVEEMVRLNETLSYEKMKVEAILSSMADALVVTNLSGDILTTNPAAERIFGIDRSLLLGRSYQLLFSGIGLEDLWKKGLHGKTSFTEISLKKPKELFFRVIVSPMRNVDGAVQGVIFLLQDITELKRVTQMKSEIVSMVTHDLKTPLTSIQGFVEVILSRDLPPETLHNYLVIVNEETVRLVRLINNLLDLAKLEAGEFKLNQRPVDLIKIIRSIIPTLTLRSSNHEIVFVPPAFVPKVFADEDLIIQVLNNLLSNAIKYSPEGGKITINLRWSENLVEVDISDQGIGIPHEKLPRLFDRFYRVDSKASKGIAGTGLGLANVKYIVEAHGGHLRVRSGEGKGSTFTFSLPVAAG